MNGNTVLQSVRSELLEMAAEDLRVREELARNGALFEGYHPRMREVHEHNAARLLELLNSHGWLGRTLVGEEGAAAGWLILQHAIGNPPLQRRGLELMKVAAASGEVSPVHVAMLEDRIRANEGRGQLFGTQFDWDSVGLISPLPIEDEANVDKRRAEIGLMPLSEDIRRKRRSAAENGETPPQDWHARQVEIRDWLRSTGWRESED